MYYFELVFFSQLRELLQDGNIEEHKELLQVQYNIQ